MEEEGVRIRLCKGGHGVHSVNIAPSYASSLDTVQDNKSNLPVHIYEDSSLSASQANKDEFITVTSPFVGTFYRASSKENRPFVEEGDIVKIGDVLCIVEAMKLMNEIESEVDGKIVSILVENSDPVEYGQPLFKIEPLSQK